MNSSKTSKESPRVESIIRPPLGLPAEMVGIHNQTGWRKERKEKAALEEKAAKDIQAAKQQLEPDEVDENPEANGCCIMF